jgi:hypothetical protein
MLPLIVIGADERTEQAIRGTGLAEPSLRFFENTDQAVYALNDDLSEAVREGTPFRGMVEFDGGRNAWRANVAYGPRVLGWAAVAQSPKLPHTGWTLTLTWDLPDPAAPRRVVDGTPEGQDQSTIATQAAIMLGANLLIDLQAGSGYGLSMVLNQMRQRVEP